MVELRQTSTFAAWIARLRDRKAQAIIAKRLIRLQSGLVGDVKAVGGGVMEARIHYGPGYRLYYVQRGAALIVLLCGGAKSLQEEDIALAKHWLLVLIDGDAHEDRDHSVRSRCLFDE